MKNYSLLPHNTFGIDVTAANFLEYRSEEELAKLIAESAISVPYLHIGAGSNLLFTKNYEGTILHSCIDAIEVTSENNDSVSVRVGSGVVWDDFVDYCVQRNWYGIENLSLIPGEVGASAVQNIGAYGVEVKDFIASVETINIEGEKQVYQADQCQYAYRSSLFKKREMKSVFVTFVNFVLSKHEAYLLDYGTVRQEVEKYQQVTLPIVRKAIIDIRNDKLPDPKMWGNAGSFFMNPIVPVAVFEALLPQYPTMPHYRMGDSEVKIPAGWLIEQCGWKGKSLGPAAVHDKQALVLVNRGRATGKDIVALSDAIQAAVYEKFGIAIQPEVNIV